MKFDWEKPTVQMLGRWQPWHDGHTELFKRIHAMTGILKQMKEFLGKTIILLITIL